MHKLGLLLLFMLIATLGSALGWPFVPVAIYFFFATLRPQSIWSDGISVVMDPSFPFSLLVALMAIVVAFIWRLMLKPAALMSQGHVLPRSTKFNWLSGTSIAYPRFTLGHYALGLFALWITLSFINARSWNAAEETYKEYAKTFLMIFVASLVTVKIKQTWTLMILVFAALAYIAYEMNSYYFLSGYNYIQLIGYAGLDNNGAGLLIVLSFPLCVFLFDHSKHWSRFALLIPLAFIGHCILMTFSRGAMISTLLTMPFYLLRCRNKAYVLGFYALMAVAVPVLAGKEIVARFQSTAEYQKDDSANSRLTTWAIAWRMANEEPLFGFGVRNSSLFTYNYGADEQGRVIHSTWLQIAADSGIGGLVCYAIFCLSVFYSTFRIRRSINGHVTTFAFLSAAVRMIAGYGWHPKRISNGIDGVDAQRALTMAFAIEASMFAWCFGCAFLSLETLEPPYILAFIAMQTWSLVAWEKQHVAIYGHLPKAVPEAVEPAVVSHQTARPELKPAF